MNRTALGTIEADRKEAEAALVYAAARRKEFAVLRDDAVAEYGFTPASFVEECAKLVANVYLPNLDATPDGWVFAATVVWMTVRPAKRAAKEAS